MSRLGPLLCCLATALLAACFGSGTDEAGTLCGHPFGEAFTLTEGGVALSVEPAVAALNDGSFLVVFGENVDPNTMDYMGRWRHYEQETGWSDAKSIGTSDTIQELEIFSFDDSEIVAVWMQSGDEDAIFSSTWLDDEFEAPVNIGESATYCGVLDAAKDDHGRVRAAWEDQLNSNQIATRVYQSGSGWSNVELIYAVDLRKHCVLTDREYGDFVFWVENVAKPEGLFLYAQGFDGDSLSGAPVTIASPQEEGLVASELKAISNGHGGFWIAWVFGRFVDGTQTDKLELFYFEYETQIWDGPITVVDEGDGGSIDQLHLAVESDGTGLILWAEDGRQSLHFARFDETSVLDRGKIFDGFVNLGDLSVSEDGAIFVWASDGALRATCTNEDGSWADPTILTTPSGEVSTPFVASGEDGSSVIVWHHNDSNDRSIKAITSQ